MLPCILMDAINTGIISTPSRLQPTVHACSNTQGSVAVIIDITGLHKNRCVFSPPFLVLSTANTLLPLAHSLGRRRQQFQNGDIHRHGERVTVQLALRRMCVPSPFSLTVRHSILSRDYRLALSCTRVMLLLLRLLYKYQSDMFL